MKEEGVSIAPFPAILFDPSTNQRASCGFVSSQSPSDNGLKPRSFPSPPSRGPWRARLSSTVRVQIHPISYEPIQTNVATPSMRRVQRKTSGTIGSTHPKKQQEKMRSKRKTNIHRTRRGRRRFLLNYGGSFVFLCGYGDFSRSSCEDLVPPITEQHGRWQERRGPSRILRSRGADLRLRPHVLCGTSIRTFVCRRGSVHGLVASSRRTANVDREVRCALVVHEDV